MKQVLHSCSVNFKFFSVTWGQLFAEVKGRRNLPGDSGTTSRSLWWSFWSRDQGNIHLLSESSWSSHYVPVTVAGPRDKGGRKDSLPTSYGAYTST